MIILYNPKDILTEEGLKEYMMHVRAIEHHLFYITNDMDDLHIGATDPNLEETILNFREILPTLETGNGETEE
tara:strand:+ start:3232 stop:3450 length:219 start_codon:yes stop_codon:yes gene_type:complete